MVKPHETTRPRAAVAGRDSQGQLALRVDRASKSYPGIHALKGVSVELEPGELHALVGENGAGKSTLAKVISGAEIPETGRVEIGGEDRTGSGPRAHAQAGVAMVYQEPSVVPHMTAADNVFLGRPLGRGPLVSRRGRARRFRRLADDVGVDIEPAAIAGTLSVAKQRLLDVLRALHAECRVLIMDEPTASLGPMEREALYDVIARLKQAGVALLYISHDLEEVLRLADRVSVMRDGSLVATRPREEWTAPDLVRQMLGREVPPAQRSTARPQDDVVLRAENVTVPGAVSDVSLSLRRGEILGVAGLMGSGCTALLRALAGAEPDAHGTLLLDDRPVRWPRSVREAMRRGIVLSPENRKTEGLVAGMSAVANVTLANAGRAAIGPVLSRTRMRARAAELTGRIGFAPERLGAPAGTLSGGNQQKLVIAKCLNREPRVLLLDEPTTGIDVGAKAELFATVAALAADGMSIVITSSEFEEVVGIANRVLVLSAGRQAGVLEGDDRTVEGVLRLAFRLTEGHSPATTEGAAA